MTWKFWEWFSGKKKRIVWIGVDSMPITDKVWISLLGPSVLQKKLTDRLVLADKCNTKMQITQMGLSLYLNDANNNWVDLFPAMTCDWVINISEQLPLWLDDCHTSLGTVPMNFSLGDTM